MTVGELVAETAGDLTKGQNLLCGREILWNGERFRIVQVACLPDDHWQCVLEFVGRKRLPLSIPATDLTDAVSV